jgi:hypothetical protein
MRGLFRSLPVLCGAALLLGLALPGSSWGGDKKKDKGDGQKPYVIQIDLNKLPPDVAKRLLELSTAGQKKASPAPETKAPAAPAAKAKVKGLPPGLAKKPADHPGVLAYLKAHPEAKPAAPPVKGKKPAKKDDDDDD